MNIAFFTVDGYGLPIAYHLQEEGHNVYVGQVDTWDKVKVQVKENDKQKKLRLALYDGMFRNKQSADALLEYLLRQPNPLTWFVFCDFNWLWPYADKLREANYRGLLPHRDDYELEHDRNATRKLIERLYPEIETGDYKEFKHNQDGIDFLEENEDKLYVLKGFNSDAETIVPDSDDPTINREIILDCLENDKDGLYEKDGFILEEKIPDVIEFTPAAMAFDGEVRCVNIDIEHKRFGSRAGPQVGCATNLVLWQNDNETIYRKFLKPLEKRMLRTNELTFWDLSVLYSPSRKKYYAGEFCPNRMGFDAVFSEICTWDSTTQWLEHLLGVDHPYRPIAVALRIFNPNTSDALIIGNPADPDVWIYDIHEKDGRYHTLGNGKDAIVLTESGYDLDETIDALYDLEHDVVFDPGYHLEKRDWYDTKWPINILHRLEVLKELGLVKGGEEDAQKVEGQKVAADSYRTGQAIGSATGQTGY